MYIYDIDKLNLLYDLTTLERLAVEITLILTFIDPLATCFSTIDLTLQYSYVDGMRPHPI